MDEKEYEIIEPCNVVAPNHIINDWVMKCAVISTFALSFGVQSNAGILPTSFGSSQGVYAPVCDGGNFEISEELVSELNTNAEIKERLISRLQEFKDTLKQGWNGGNELPMELQSVSNALDAIAGTASEEFINWTIFPSPNGTILFSPTNDLIGGISIGNTDFSYAAVGKLGQEVKCKEVFSVKSFKLAIRLLNSLNEV
jgi:hypothetical protein